MNEWDRRPGLGMKLPTHRETPTERVVRLRMTETERPGRNHDRMEIQIDTGSPVPTQSHPVGRSHDRTAVIRSLIPRTGIPVVPSPSRPKNVGLESQLLRRSTMNGTTKL